MDISFENKRKPKRGRVLLSDPFSNDDYFKRSVVYLCEHHKDGSFGFVLNNYIDLDLFEISKNFPKIDTKISIGGPVQTENIFFLHTLGADKIEGSLKIEDGIFLGGSYDQLVDLINAKKVSNKEVRFFLGYSGWSANQLQEELDQHAWIVAPVLNPLEVMDFNVEKLWEKFMKREGKKFDLLSQFPVDLTLN